MRSILTHLRHLDWIIIGSVVLLAAMGLLSLYSSSMGRGDFANFYKQAVFLGHVQRFCANCRHFWEYDWYAQNDVESYAILYGI